MRQGLVEGEWVGDNKLFILIRIEFAIHATGITLRIMSLLNFISQTHLR